LAYEAGYLFLYDRSDSRVDSQYPKKPVFKVFVVGTGVFQHGVRENSWLLSKGLDTAFKISCCIADVHFVVLIIGSNVVNLQQTI